MRIFALILGLFAGLALATRAPATARASASRSSASTRTAVSCDPRCPVDGTCAASTCPAAACGWACIDSAGAQWAFTEDLDGGESVDSCPGGYTITNVAAGSSTSWDGGRGGNRARYQENTSGQSGACSIAVVGRAPPSVPTGTDGGFAEIWGQGWLWSLTGTTGAGMVQLENANNNILFRVGLSSGCASVYREGAGGAWTFSVANGGTCIANQTWGHVRVRMFTTTPSLYGQVAGSYGYTVWVNGGNPVTKSGMSDWGPWAMSEPGEIKFVGTSAGYDHWRLSTSSMDSDYTDTLDGTPLACNSP